MKFYQKKEVSLEKTPILLPLERRHTLAGGREGDPERPISRANSVGSVAGLMGTPPAAMTPPLHKCHSEDRRLTRAPTIVITESELSSSLLYNNRKAKMQIEAANEATPVALPHQQTSRRQQPPSPRPSPRPKPAEPSKSRKGRTVWCSYAMIALFICLASVGILLAIGGIIYMELFSAYTPASKASTKDSPGANALGEADRRLPDSLMEEDDKLNLDSNKDRFGVVRSDKEINRKEVPPTFLEKMILLDEPSTPDEASAGTPDFDLSSIDLRGLLDKAFFEIPKELSKMLPSLADFELKEETLSDRESGILDPDLNSHKEMSKELNDGSVKSSTPEIVEHGFDSHEVSKLQSPNEGTLNKDLTDGSLHEKIEHQNGDNKHRSELGDTKENRVSYEVSNPDEQTPQIPNIDNLKVHEPQVPNIDNLQVHEPQIPNIDNLQVHEPQIPNIDNLKVHVVPFERDGKTNVDKPTPLDDLSANFTEMNNSSNLNDSTVAEIGDRPVDESRAMPLEFFQRLGFDRDSIMANPLLSVDDMNVKFSISEALKVLRSLDNNNLPSTREKSTIPAKVRKVQQKGHNVQQKGHKVQQKGHNVGKERREYLTKLRKNMLLMNGRI